MTETPSDDTLLDGSHVVVALVGGQGKLFGIIGMLGGGLVALLGSAIDNARTQSTAKESTGFAIDMMKLKWFNEMNAALKKSPRRIPKCTSWRSVHPRSRV